MTDCPSQSSHLFITDKTSKCRFLVVTGSDLCCFAKIYLKSYLKHTSFELGAANNSIIKNGYHQINLDFGLKKTFPWKFVIADVSLPIIGSDFLSYFNLLPDCRQKWLPSGDSASIIPGRAASHVSQHSIKALTLNNSPFNSILAEFPNLLRPPASKREVRHSTV